MTNKVLYCVCIIGSPDLVCGCRLCEISFMSVAFMRFCGLHFNAILLASPSCDFMSIAFVRFLIGDSFFFVCCVLGCLFFIGDLFSLPLACLRLPLFYRRPFFLAPCVFGVASVFIGGLFFHSPCILGLGLFSSHVFFLALCVFGVTSFFIGGLFS
jgi:hypothetical protein